MFNKYIWTKKNVFIKIGMNVSYFIIGEFQTNFFWQIIDYVFSHSHMAKNFSTWKMINIFHCLVMDKWDNPAINQSATIFDAIFYWKAKQMNFPMRIWFTAFSLKEYQKYKHLHQYNLSLELIDENNFQ